MKPKVNLKKIISYVLAFALIFSMVQVSNGKVAKAAIVNQIDGLSIYSGSASGDMQSIDKNSRGEYIAELLPMASTFTLVPSSGYTIKSVTSSNSSKMKIRGPLSGNYTISTITDYSDFVLTVTMTTPDSTDPVTYSIIMNFDTSSALEFSTMKVTLDNEDPISFSYGDATDGVYDIPNVESTIKTATIALYDSLNKPMTFKVNGGTSKKVNLDAGTNTITVTVTNSGISKDYTVVIEKQGEAKLKSLIPSAGKLSPTFNSDIYDYTVDVPTTQKTIAFTPVTVDNTSKVKVNGVTVKSGNKSNEIRLSEGTNDVTIAVTNDDGTTTYNVEVTRAQLFRSDNLKALKLSSGTLSPAFNKDVYDYTATVENTVSSVTVTPTAEDTNATITVNDVTVPSGTASSYINLDEGNNIITIKVTDTNDNSETYVINVSRKYSKDNVRLGSLSVTDGTMSPSFDPDTYLYSVHVERNIDKVKVKFKPQNEDATVNINGQDYLYNKGQNISDYIDLNIGANLVTVTITGKGSKKTVSYSLSIIRGEIQANNQWVLQNGNWTFYDGYGTQVKNQWVIYDNNWYFLDINGYMQTGWLQESGNYYYLNEKGIMQTGWFYDKGYWYYLQGNGMLKTNSWGQYNGNWYLFNDLGEIQTSGWTLYGPYWYYLNDKGIMQKGWITYDKNKYYLNDDGTMRSGWLYTGAKWYYLSYSGAMVTGWQYINEKWYYFDANGVMKTGMLFLDGKWYNLN